MHQAMATLQDADVTCHFEVELAADGIDEFAVRTAMAPTGRSSSGPSGSHFNVLWMSRLAISHNGRGIGKVTKVSGDIGYTCRR